MSNLLYVLDGHEPRREPDSLKWGQWFETALEQRIVAKTKLLDGSEVNTVFLGLDHQWGEGPPMLFVTGVFFDPSTVSVVNRRGERMRESGIVARYSTWSEAELGHMELVERLIGGVTMQIILPPAMQGWDDVPEEERP